MIYLCLLLLLCSCSSYYQDAAAQLRDGHFEEAEKNLSKADQHYSTSNEAALLLLSRAMVYFQKGQFDKSTNDFEKALDAIDYYKQISIPEIAGQTLIQDDLAAYVPPPYEQSLARFYQALAFLHQGDEDNAAATIHYLENHSEQNSLTTYLLATLFQRRGDASNARVLYSRLKIEAPTGNVLLIHHRGVAPQKKTEVAPASVVSAALLESILQVKDIKPALSTLTGVPIPVLVNSIRPTNILKVDHHSQSPVVSFDIARAAEDHLDKEMPWTAARAAARLLIRRGLVASTKEKAQPFVDLAMLISNIATQADTRSWAMLPSCIDLYQLDLEPGKHQVQVGKQSATITINSKNLTIIEVFQPNSDKLITIKDTL